MKGLDVEYLLLLAAYFVGLDLMVAGAYLIHWLAHSWGLW